MLNEIFGIYEGLLTQNPTGQDSQLSLFFQTIWKTVVKSKNMGLQRIIYARKLFQNLLNSKFYKMAEKLNFIVFGALFLFEVHIQQRSYSTWRKSSWSVIRRKKSEHLKIMKKSIMAAQKCKHMLFQAALKDF